jgi:peptide/nickel transport system substrate-binding protein
MMALATAACGATGAPRVSPAPSPTSSPAAEGVAPPLAIAAPEGLSFTRDFNPFDPRSTASALSVRSLVYEPLYEIDALNPSLSGMHPWLATGYAFEEGGTELRITVRSGVRLSDGSGFGTADVAATFRAIRDEPAADYSGVPAQSADPSVSGSMVTLHFPAPEFTATSAVLGGTYMVPAALITRLGSRLTTAALTDPVGTGPFVLASVSSQELRFTANDRYWDGRPPEPQVEISDVTAAPAPDPCTGGVAPGQDVDWSGQRPATVFADCIDLGPAAYQLWFASGSTVTLDFNLATGNGGATGIADPMVRQAVSLGIDRTVLSSIGEAGYEAAATSAGGLTPGQQAAYPDAIYTNDLPVDSAATPSSVPSWGGATVQSTLEQDGYTPPADWGRSSEAGCDGTIAANCWRRDGQIISFSIWDPESVSDCWADAQEISGELQSEGMDVTTDNAAGGEVAWAQALAAGDFQTAIREGEGGSVPFVQLDNWLDYAADCTGTPLICASGDYGRFDSPAAQAALTAYEGADPTAAAGQQTIDSSIASLEQIMASQVPVAPILYGADWNVYSTVRYSGWPTARNPYMDPSPADPELPYILMQLSPVPS